MAQLLLQDPPDEGGGLLAPPHPPPHTPATRWSVAAWDAEGWGTMETRVGRGGGRESRGWCVGFAWDMEPRRPDSKPSGVSVRRAR